MHDDEDALDIVQDAMLRLAPLRAASRLGMAAAVPRNLQNRKAWPMRVLLIHTGAESPSIESSGTSQMASISWRMPPFSSSFWTSSDTPG